MIVKDPEDLLSYLITTGPITLDELATRTSSGIPNFAQLLLGLLDKGDVVVEGNAAAVRDILSGTDSAAPSGRGDVRGDFFDALKAQDLHEAKLQLSGQGFKKARSLWR